MTATELMPLTAYTPKEVAGMFGMASDRWLRDGVRAGKYPCLRMAKNAIRFTAEHVQEIRKMHEEMQRQKPALKHDPYDLFGAVKSKTGNRTKKS
ncbi:hypothetical protein [Amycolatopsis sp. DSM 110486]|uniref:hypothetical protein n=1 Tax=Amycolatopsis sp. DSM 110486 TaxID=2865832 RepID=UPI001C6944A5|nr:hypothetical protein [Amycolatopsis sp. DSM 110486]QYN17441.1 hypothetical protein K1T34_32155 [Amycolatopsis sp. DSM 110486]